MTATLDFQPLLDAVQTLRTANVEASTDPSELNLPGVWVTLDRLRPRTVAGDHELVAAFYLIAPEADYTQSMAQLATLYNAVRAAGVSPDGDVVAVPVTLSQGGTALPALRMPVNIYS